MNVTLYRDLPSEHWFSMERYANELVTAMRNQDVNLREYVFPRPLPGLGGRAGALLNHAWRTLVYPLAARSCQGDVNHVLDHSYAHLLHALDPRRTVVTCHDIAPLALKERGAGLSRYLWDLSFQALAKAACIIADSDATRSELLRTGQYPENRITTVWLGVNPEFGLRAANEHIDEVRHEASAQGRPLVLHIGSCAPRKNVEVLITALSTLRNLHPRWVQVGGHFNPTQRALIQRLSLEENILQIPPTSEQRLRAWYQAADVFVFPSRYEGFGMPVLEAMASGTPVVCSNVSSLPEIAGEAALLIDPDDAAALAAAIRAVLTDPTLRRDLIERGLARCQQFTWENTARSTLAVYRKVWDEL